jgi:type II secretory pathway pseudopilin PulG
MDTPRFDSEEGLGMIEMVIAIVILQVALLALLSAFSASAVEIGRADSIQTASSLADSQMELYRSMIYDAIGLDTAGAPTSGMYVADTGVCPSGQTPVCSNTPPRNNGVTGTWSCTAASGSTSVSTYYSANGVNPCVAHRTVSGSASPDGKTYYVDTYILWGVLKAGQRSSKQVSVVVRNFAGTVELAKQVSTFDCSLAQAPNSTSC